MLQERSNITASFTEHVKFQKKESFYNTLGEEWQIKVKKTRVRRSDTLKMLYRCKCNI